jgi:hypothetical protein
MFIKSLITDKDNVAEIIYDGSFGSKDIIDILDKFIINEKSIKELVDQNNFNRIFIGVLNGRKDKKNWYVLEKSATSAFYKKKSNKKKSMKKKSNKKKSMKKKSNKKKSMKKL